MNYHNLKIRTLIRAIYNVKGILLPNGISFIIFEKSIKIVDPKMETCLIYLDNGKNNLEEFEQHIVNKKILYENSI